ncbi:MAG: xylan 1,4-beta-xylosidase [Clostridia bacterium]|nr:xylan 1,4-beta-xylosidase [Clostridia bacterium]
MSNKNARFEVIYKEGGAFSATKKIVQDNETGVQYLLVECGYGFSITPLLDRDGKPVVDPRYEY